MPVAFEFKAKGKPCQYKAIDQAIRPGQFIRNKCIRLWMDVEGTGKYDLSAYCKTLAEYPFAQKLNSTPRQAMSERACSSISRFFENGKRKVPGKKQCDRAPSHRYQIKQIKRVRLMSRADGYYVPFLIDTDVSQRIKPTGKTIGLDVGLKEFYTDSNSELLENYRFYRQGKKRMKFDQRRVSRKNKASANRKKAINKLGRVHLQISRQRLALIRENPAIVIFDSIGRILAARGFDQKQKLALPILEWKPYQTLQNLGWWVTAQIKIYGFFLKIHSVPNPPYSI